MLRHYAEPEQACWLLMRSYAAYCACPSRVAGHTHGDACCGMESMPDYGKWIREGLELRGMTRKSLAKRLGMADNAVGRWIKGQIKRGPTLEQVEKIAQILQLDPPEATGIRLVRMEPTVNGGVQFMGYIGKEISAQDHKHEPAAPAPRPMRRTRYPDKHQVYFEMDTPSTELRIAAGDQLICVPWALYRTEPQATDRVICRRERDGLVRYTLAVAQMDGDSVVLRGVQDGPKPRDIGEPAYLVITVLHHTA